MTIDPQRLNSSGSMRRGYRSVTLQDGSPVSLPKSLAVKLVSSDRASGNTSRDVDVMFARRSNSNKR